MTVRPAKILGRAHSFSTVLGFRIPALRRL